MAWGNANTIDNQNVVKTSALGVPGGVAILDDSGKLVQMPNASDINMTGYDNAAAAITEAIRLANAAATAATYTTTLAAAGWSDTAPYTQTVAVSGILATDSPIVDIVLTEGNETAELEAWGYIGRIDTAADSITATCFENKPSIDFSIQMKVVR